VPDQEVKQRSWTFIAAATAASGGLYYFSLGLEGYRFLAWIASLPVLFVITEVRAGIGAMIAFFAYLLGAASLAPYLSRLVPLPVLLATLVVPSAAFAAAASAFCYALARDHAIEAVIIFLAAWTSYEFVLSLVSPHGTAGSIAYSQADFLQLIQVCSLTGIWGLTFLLTFVPAGVGVAWHLRRTWKQSVPITVGTLNVIALPIIFGRNVARSRRRSLSGENKPWRSR
jgi:apolipoprotein N-acyltransferase